MNRYLFGLLRRIEEGERRLTSTITHNADKPMREIILVDTEIAEIEDALASFKREAAAEVADQFISNCRVWASSKLGDGPKATCLCAYRRKIQAPAW